MFLFLALFRALAFQLLNIPTDSMAPTLVTGDTIVVAKFAYGYSRYSAPEFLALATLPSGRIFAVAPRRGDLVEFRFPRDGKTNYVKRVIGLPGDRIQMTGGRLYINGKIVDRQPLSSYRTTGRFGEPVEVAHYLERLPGGAEHEIIQLVGDTNSRPYTANTEAYEVPSNAYFVLGDNRDASFDSRIPAAIGGIGFVPDDNLEGRVAMVLYSTEMARGAADLAPAQPRWFMTIH
jgi:signal peptidase I